MTYASSAPHWRPSRRRRPNEPGPKTALAVDKSCSKRPRPRYSRAKLPWNSHAVSAPAGCRAWWTDHSSLFSAVGADTSLFEALDAALAEVGDEDAPALSAVLAEHTEAGTETLRERRREAEAEISASHASIAALKSERKASRGNTTTLRLPSTHAPTTAVNWVVHRYGRLVRFADSVEPDVATGIESALQAANLLDAGSARTRRFPSTSASSS